MEKEAVAPKQIQYSLYAFLGAIVVGLGFSIVGVLMGRAKLPRSDIAFSFLEAAVIVFLMLLMLRRKKWARTVYTILIGLEVLAVFVGVLAALMGVEPVKRALPLGMYNLTAWFLGVFLRILSVYLLYVRQSHDWFTGLIADNDGGPSGPEELPHVSDRVSRDAIQRDAVPLVDAAPWQASPSVPGRTLNRASRWRRIVMRRKSVLAGGVILCTCLATILVYSAQRAARADAIRSALSADVGLSRQISSNRSLAENDAKVIETYTQGLRRIDMSGCPGDFQMAYLEHIQAWESLARSRASVDIITPLFQLLVLKQMPNPPDSSEERSIRERIAKTWDRIERIALSHGVRTPQ